jgi:hypothetical protein
MEEARLPSKRPDLPLPPDRIFHSHQTPTLASLATPLTPTRYDPLLQPRGHLQRQSEKKKKKKKKKCKKKKKKGKEVRGVGCVKKKVCHVCRQVEERREQKEMEKRQKSGGRREKKKKRKSY